MVHNPVIIIGIGEIGSVVARGCLKLGYPVVPVRRDTNLQALATMIQSPAMVVLAVAEKDLHPALEHLPHPWRAHLVLVQNELLPADWEQHGLTEPTVMSVWFEKKPGREWKEIVPSVVYGPKAALLSQALGALGISVRYLADEDQLVFELVRKNLYILTTNIAGLKTGGNVRDLWANHATLARAVADDVLTLQGYLTGRNLEAEALLEAMLVAFDGDPEHQCTGRSAQARLERALQTAQRAGLEVPTLKRIATELRSVA